MGVSACPDSQGALDMVVVGVHGASSLRNGRPRSGGRQEL